VFRSLQELRPFDDEETTRVAMLGISFMTRLENIKQRINDVVINQRWADVYNIMNDYLEWHHDVNQTASAASLEANREFIEATKNAMISIYTKSLEELQKTKAMKTHAAGSLITVLPDKPIQKAVRSMDPALYESLSPEQKAKYDEERTKEMKENLDSMNKWLSETSGNVNIQEMQDRYRQSGIVNDRLIQKLMNAELRSIIGPTFIDVVKNELLSLGITDPARVDRYIVSKLKQLEVKAGGVLGDTSTIPINAWDIINEVKKDIAVISQGKAGLIPLMNVYESQPEPSYKTRQINESVKTMAEGDLMNKTLDESQNRFILVKLKEINDDGYVGDKLNETMKQQMHIDEFTLKRNDDIMNRGVLVLDPDRHLVNYLT
jgi:hypothetical protein